MNMHEFDDIIKQKAQQREADVTPDLWEGINQKKKKRRMPFFWLMTIVLLFGAAAIVLNMANKNKAVDIANAEKKNAQENNVSSNIGDDKNTKLTGNSIHLTDNSVIKSMNKSSTANDSLHIVVSNANPGLIKRKNIVEKSGHYVSRGSRKKAILISNKTSEENNEKLFSSIHKKKTTKGYARINIVAGETGDLTAASENEPQTLLSSKNKSGNRAISKTNVIIGEQDSISITSKMITNINQDENEPVAFLKKNSEDSQLVKKVLPVITDSATNKNPLTITTIKKEKKSQKKNTLKLEAGITVFFPFEQYSQPHYVKRVIEKPNVRSTFISSNIKTTIETGSGFSVGVVKGVNKKWSAGAGVQYLRMSERVQFSGIESHDNYTIIERLVTDPNGNFLKRDTVSSITRDNTTLTGRNIYTSVSIPLFVRYHFLDRKKWSASVTTGVYVDLLRKYHNDLPGKFETVYSYGTESATSKNTIGFDVFAGIHVDGKLYKKYEWFAEPSFRYNLSAYKTNNLSFNKKIHKPGVTIGVARNF